jgi:hypothetical protein
VPILTRTGTAKTVLAALQTEIIALQEAALTDAAQRSPRPIKDHRRRVLQTPFGTAALRVPRLRGRADDAKLATWPRHARSTPECGSARGFDADRRRKPLKSRRRKGTHPRA